MSNELKYTLVGGPYDGAVLRPMAEPECYDEVLHVRLPDGSKGYYHMVEDTFEYVGEENE